MQIIIPCGSKKRIGKYPAYQLYLGAYFLSCLRFALSNTDRKNIFILSAKYGLISLDRVIETYNVKMGQPGCVDVDTVRQQANDMKIVDNKTLAIGGKLYTNVARSVFSTCITPLDGIGGMGMQMQWMKQNRGRFKQ